MEPIPEVKEIVQKLESKLKSAKTSEYGKKETFEEFVKPLFENLGWDFATDVSKEESVSQNKADYGFKINDVTRFYLTTVPIDQSLEDRELIIPLTTFAFNRGVTWGVLTNFRKIRLFMSEARGRSPAHMQFFELSSEEFLSDFEKLSYLTKKSLSLNTLDSDAVYFAKKKKKSPIDQQLLEDLLDYRDRLSKNIVKNNPKLTQEQVSHSVQKILNRFIFIRSCGDRQIEERHLQSSLNQWREEKKKRDLIEHIRNTFSYFYGRYGSSLFEKHICDNLQISNFVLEEIIEGLYQSENKAVRYDFSLISSDILGKIYENYLGIIQRKQDGAYYTPSYISKYIAENTIIPYLSKSNVTKISDLISEYADNIKELESKIQNIKILDPACGTGEFLIRAIDILLEISKAIQNHKEKGGKYSYTGKKKKSESATYATFDKEIEGQKLRIIIQNNIFGVDINEEAIEITQLNLFLKLATSSKQLLDVSKNIRIGNSLVDDKSISPKAFDWKKEFPDKFDVVIGNPPYSQKNPFEKEEKQWLTSKYPENKSNMNTASIFITLAKNLTKEDCFYSMIVPKSLTYTKGWFNDRKRLQTDLFNLVDAGKAWKEVLLEQVIFAAQKNSSNESYSIYNLATKNSINIEKKISDEIGILLSSINETELALCFKIKEQSTLLGKISNTFAGLPYQSKLKPKGDLAAVGGNEIGRYKIKGKKGFFQKDFIKRINDKINQFTKPKIISQRIVAHVKKPVDRIILMSTYDEDKIVGVNTVTCLRLNDVNYDLKSILLILNSELISWYAYRFVYNKAIRSMDLYDYFISKIPISNSLLKYQLLFNFVSECILYLNKNQPDSDYVNKFYFISNIIVFDMYFKNEIKTTLNDMFLQQVSQMHKLNQKVDLDSIKKFMNFFSSREIKEQITKILQNPNFHKITNNTFQN